MEIFREKEKIQAWSDQMQKESKTVCLVPTMGFLHQGHLSLMEMGKKECDKVVISIFVNPTQFGENEDLDAYPKDLENDLKLAQGVGVDAVYLPDNAGMYPENYQTYVELTHLPNHLCGRFRPVHFRGVATVVTKLFNSVKPNVAIFGQKDYQQLQVIHQMTQDLDWNIKIIGGPIVREPDGLAMSSRNTYMSPDERKSALSLSRSLKIAEQEIQSGGRNVKDIQNKIQSFIESFPFTKVEYIAFCHPETLEEISRVEGRFLLALAVKVGTTRLIDNQVIDPEQ